MEANKTRQVTDAKYKSQFFSSIYRSSPKPQLQTSHPDDAVYQQRKFATDRMHRATTYHVSYGKEKFTLL